MSTDELEANLAPRTGCAVLAVPIVLAAILVGGYAAFLVASVRGKPAAGDVVTVSFAGCDEARPLVEARVAAMGLGDPVWTDTEAGFDLTARLPADPMAAAEIPATLAARGALAVHGGPGTDAPVLATRDDVSDAVMRIDFTAAPRVGITFTPEAAARIAANAVAHPDTSTSVWIDGVRALDRFNGPDLGWDRLDLAPSGDNATVVHTVAAWALVLEHGPLPCDLAVVEVP